MWGTCLSDFIGWRLAANLAWGSAPQRRHLRLSSSVNVMWDLHGASEGLGEIARTLCERRMFEIMLMETWIARQWR